MMSGAVSCNKYCCHAAIFPCLLLARVHVGLRVQNMELTT